MASLASFRCPIGHEMMVDPVVASDGHTYERAQIARWLQTHDSSPITNGKLATKALLPNHTLKQAIAEFQSYVASSRRREREDDGPADRPAQVPRTQHTATRRFDDEATTDDMHFDPSGGYYSWNGGLDRYYGSDSESD
ncbi:hypothetical protein SPRG_03294 [Saprolegnia parasitica CBS 223.65]|uniref:U-box domain-containing protein n=1 Tax=Saprolegnia parasitica (strain CBS 223.65) TaxID=695850 RepID=A0A067CS52_SAPPC|nr:hypothetical protein SPRG_03294 [Saprolegnia parasitica CBS 223.65]KDO32075.1 hypothetical protein SPRG_03294 [Saprolegnia parasitica CBS 223.65]|eukprot:XP_012197263.1 hypothetical protein SPRG_03294 [Saprolegnia parasitica CBS 223.65]